MKLHHTKNKGDLGLLKVQLDLTEQGFTTFTSTSEHQDFDLIAYKEGSFFKRVQVKYITAKEGTISINFRSSWCDKNGMHHKDINKLEIDVYAIYCPNTDECYYIDPNKYNKSLNLRIIVTENNDKRIKYAKDFKYLAT